MATDDKKPTVGKATEERLRRVQRRYGTPPRGIQSENWDDDVTPPPQEPPRPAALAGMPVEQRVHALADTLGELHSAVDRLWDERGNSEQIGRLQTAVAGYASMVNRHQQTLADFLMPGVKSLLAAVESLRLGAERTAAQLEQFFEREWPRHEELMERFSKALDDIANRMTRLEAAVERLHSSDEALAARLRATEAVMSQMDVRVTALERKQTETALVANAVDGERKRWFSWARAGIAVVAAGVGFVVSHVGDIADWFRK